jgi:hypothetical protein
MELNVNSPAYYSNTYYIDNDVYRMCKELYVFMKNKDYSEVLKIIGIIPVVAPKEVLKDSSCWKEHIEFKCKNEVATVWVHINFNDYHIGDSETKKTLILDAIIKSAERISKKSKVKFNLEKFKEDILYFSQKMSIIAQ